MTVYVVACDGNRRVKIGSTVGIPEKRLAQLQCGSPHRLRLLWVSDPEYGRDAEMTLHTLFSSYRAHGEWYDFGEADPAALIEAAIALPSLQPIDKDKIRPRYRAVRYREPRALRSGTAERVPPPASLLEDLADALDGLSAPIPIAKAAVLLANRFPGEVSYRDLTGRALFADLASIGVKIPTKGNRQLVKSGFIRRVLAERAAANQAAS